MTYNFYTPPRHKSQTIENFFPISVIEDILKSYDAASSIFNEFYKQPIKITEINLDPTDKKVKCFRLATRTGKEVVLNWDNNVKPINKLKKKQYFKWTTSITQQLESFFDEYNIPARIESLNIHNLDNWIDVHCDGVNITSRRGDRPKSFPVFDSKKFQPEKYVDYAHQGLITLRNEGEKNGTIIFDQWCPISTYLSQDKYYDPKKNKKNIIFFKGEQLERFGEKVYGYTNQPMPEDQFEKIISVLDNPNNFTKDQAHGLTLDEILQFGKSGTLNVWATKKYHLPIPLKKTSWSKNRIMLQYESVYKE